MFPNCRISKLAVIVLIAVAGVLLTTSAGALSLSVSSGIVTISDVSPGGEVVLLSIAVRPSPRGHFTTQQRSNQVLKDDDGNGIILLSITADEEDPRDFRAAVDATSGALAVAAPEWRSIALEGRGFDSGATPGVVRRLATRFHFVQALVVRPGDGAWTVTAGEGGVNDDGPPADGNIRLDVSKFLPLTGEERLQQILPFDTVIIVDTADRRYFAAEGTRR